MTTTNPRRLALSLAVSFAAAAALPAQDPSEVELPAVRFVLGAEGALSGAIGDSETPHSLDEVGATLSSLGVGGLVAALFSGDLLSKTDAVDFFERLGRGSDTELLRAIARRPEDGDSRHEALLRVLAVRAAQLRGLKPALGVLQRVAEEPQVPGDLRIACAEAIASLNGATAPAGASASTAVLDSLETVPAGASLVLRIDTARMPSGTGVLRLARNASEFGMRSVAARLDPAQLGSEWFVGGLVRSASAGAAGYLLARHAGNLHLHRAVLAVRLKEDFETVPDFFLRIEGEWQAARLAEALRSLGSPIEERDGAFVGTTPDDRVVRITDRLLTLTTPGFDEPRGPDAARALATDLDASAQIALWWDASAAYPDEIAKFRIVKAALNVPTSMDGRLHLSTTWSTPQTAAAIAGLAGGLGRLLETMTDANDDLVPLTEAASEMKVVRDGARVNFDAPLPQTDLLQLAQEIFVLAYSGGF